MDGSFACCLQLCLGRLGSFGQTGFVWESFLNDQGQEQKEVVLFDALHCWKNHRPWLSQKLHATLRGFTFGKIQLIRSFSQEMQAE